jgi:exodeoxyribonuclease VII small subunit
MSTDDSSLADDGRGRPRPEAELGEIGRAEIGYEDARAQLGDVVRRLESGGQTLEESLALWQRGEELADICERWLSGATARLNTVIAAHEQGSGAARPDESTAVNRSQT